MAEFWHHKVNVKEDSHSQRKLHITAEIFLRSFEQEGVKGGT